MPRNFLSFIYAVSILLLLSFYQLFWISDYSKQKLFVLILLSVFGIVLFLIKEEPITVLKKIYIKPSVLFIISYFIVFFQLELDLLLGFTTVDDFFLGSQSVLCKSAYLSSIGLLCFFLGYCLYIPKRLKKSIYHAKYLTWPINAILSLSLLLMFLSAGSSYFRGGYSYSNSIEGSIVGVLNSWSVVFLLAVILITCNNILYHKSSAYMSFKDYLYSFSKWSICNMVTYVAMILNIGDRGPLIYIITGLFFGYYIVSNKVLSIKYLLISIGISVVVISFLGESKRYRDNNGIIERLQTTYYADDKALNESVSPFTYELSRSVMSLNYYLNEEELHMIDYQGFQLKYILSLIPFSSRIGSIFNGDINRSNFTSSSEFITWIIQGDKATYGSGTNMIVDLYMDLGLIGIVFVLILWGIFIRMIEIELFCNRMSSIFISAIGFYYISLIVSVPRSSILFKLKYAFWLFLFIAFYQFISRRIKNI